MKNISIHVFVLCFLQKHALLMLTWGETILQNKFSDLGLHKIFVPSSAHDDKFMCLYKMRFKLSAVSLNTYFWVLGL